MNFWECALMGAFEGFYTTYNKCRKDEQEYVLKEIVIAARTNQPQLFGRLMELAPKWKSICDNLDVWWELAGGPMPYTGRDLDPGNIVILRSWLIAAGL